MGMITHTSANIHIRRAALITLFDAATCICLTNNIQGEQKPDPSTANPSLQIHSP
jgi:hypothetical protein